MDTDIHFFLSYLILFFLEWEMLQTKVVQKIEAHILYQTTYFRETCQWLKFPLNGLRAQSRISPVLGLLRLASGPACLGMAFPPFLVKQLYRRDSVVLSSFVRTGYTTRRWGWLLGRIDCNITHHYPLYTLYVIMWNKFLKPDRPQIIYSAYTLHTRYVRLQTHTHVKKYLLLFHSNNGCMKATWCYVIVQCRSS